MGTGSTDTDTNLSKQYDLDGTEVYGPEGKTIADLQELNPEDLKSILDIKKELQEQPNN
ncbi:hypothetical protein [Clostridium cochlearium]|uniref:hypothetical protein n=1 Tax=Clostridium cochlearium TaxID=1494 RepID=UPI0015708E63|nr:hypothetical protein [Clostridium cochlearium]MBV1816902.1 hypothetical protein [Bacteroidales bacterium MSK.15.36]MCG4571733.1 hypothetical protein [Clostridium cochlearium]MCG4579062.1 hypothetical protein [Clostridium cochlearium]NSJ90179.1 hypothetical protein [Coprococcus sp. MSK.21.13]